MFFAPAPAWNNPHRRAPHDNRLHAPPARTRRPACEAVSEATGSGRSLTRVPVACPRSTVRLRCTTTSPPLPGNRADRRTVRVSIERCFFAGSTIAADLTATGTARSFVLRPSSLVLMICFRTTGRGSRTFTGTVAIDRVLRVCVPPRENLRTTTGVCLRRQATAARPAFAGESRPAACESAARRSAGPARESPGVRPFAAAWSLPCAASAAASESARCAAGPGIGSRRGGRAIRSATWFCQAA
jgi:hypothetical protein